MSEAKLISNPVIGANYLSALISTIEKQALGYQIAGSKKRACFSGRSLETRKNAKALMEGAQNDLNRIALLFSENKRDYSDVERAKSFINYLQNQIDTGLEYPLYKPDQRLWRYRIVCVLRELRSDRRALLQLVKQAKQSDIDGWFLGALGNALPLDQIRELAKSIVADSKIDI